MQLQRSGGFTVPFLLGTALGVLSGAVLGALVAGRAASIARYLNAKINGSEADTELRFDLLMQ